MHELVIVVSDLYLSQEVPERELPQGVALPGLRHLARFATRSKVADGWRPWLARWLTGIAPESPASVAAICLPSRRETPSSVWMATPVHLIAGLSTVHLDRRSILRLSADEMSTLAAEFQRVFHDSGFTLEPLDSGDFLLLGPQLDVIGESEPARLMGESVVGAPQGRGAGEVILRRLGAEIEMWLHDHPLNEGRRRQGTVPVTGLWLWGGGRAPKQHESAMQAGEPSAVVAFGRDAYLQGLWASIGGKVFPLPRDLAALFSYPQARRAALVIDIGSMLHSAPTWTLFDALTHIDRTFINPAVQALRNSMLDRLVFLANDVQLTVRARDRFRLWRRAPVGLSGLQ